MNRTALKKHANTLSKLSFFILQAASIVYAVFMFLQSGFNWLALSSLCFGISLFPTIMMFICRPPHTNRSMYAMFVLIGISFSFSVVALAHGGLGTFWLHYAVAGLLTGGGFLFFSSIIKNNQALGESVFEKSTQHKLINSCIRFLYTVLVLVSFLYGVYGLSVLGSGMLLGSLGALLASIGIALLIEGNPQFFVSICFVTTVGSVLSGIGLFSVAHTLLGQLMLGSSCFLPALALITCFATRHNISSKQTVPDSEDSEDSEEQPPIALHSGFFYRSGCGMSPDSIRYFDIIGILTCYSNTPDSNKAQ